MGQSRQTKVVENPQTEAERILKAQKDAYFKNPYPSLQERLDNLLKLEDLLAKNTDAITGAVTELTPCLCGGLS